MQARIFLTVLELEQGALDRAQALLDAAEPELSGPRKKRCTGASGRVC
ncbi:hypothetical protein MSS93_11125 [Deinococcus radiodurans]|nr:hypothetical protein MSS93_11125 [Deinococcus radiodurans]